MKKLQEIFKSFLQLFGAKEDSMGLLVVGFVLAIIIGLIIPLPPLALDFMLGISIALAVLIIIIAFYVQRVTDFSSFPAVLMLITLFRLTINVATTRMILSNGHLGPSAVSDIVTAFGNFVVGGNYVIGIIVFIILVIINLIVITNGSTRVTEVRARFALDAMPGKQMSIDGDLNSGYITPEEARKKREQLGQEQDFYGAMDGASKFVKGDAIASIIITLVNIIGGFLIGMFQRDMDAATAASTFTILTIGDGLAGQIPALIIAAATALIATRESALLGSSSFGGNIVRQMFVDTRPLFIVGAILLLFASVPGLPTFSLGFIALLFILCGWTMGQEDKLGIVGQIRRFMRRIRSGVPRDTTRATATLARKADSSSASTESAPAPKAQESAPLDYSHHRAPRTRKSEEEIKKEDEVALKKALETQELEIRLGYKLLVLGNENHADYLGDQIRSLRAKIAKNFGFLIPAVTIRDNMDLLPNKYEIYFRESKMGEGEIDLDKWMVIDSYSGDYVPKGVKGVDPAYGLPITWVDAAEKDVANENGLMVIKTSTVPLTHLEMIIKNLAPELLTRDEISKLINMLSTSHPIIFEEIKKVQQSLVAFVLRALLAEGIPIRELPIILEKIIDANQVNMTSTQTLIQVRTALARTISNAMKGSDGILHLYGLSPKTSFYLNSRIIEEREMPLNKNEVELLSSAIYKNLEQVGPFVLMVDNGVLRYLLTKFLKQRNLSDCRVMSIEEVDGDSKYEILGEIDVEFE